jgi:hypothetical protein
MAVLRGARSPPHFEKMTGLLVIDDKEMSRKGRTFVIAGNTLYCSLLLSL